MPDHRQRDFRTGSPRHCNKQGPVACRSDANHSLILNGMDAEAESGEEIDADCCTSAPTHAGTCRHLFLQFLWDTQLHSGLVILALEGKGKCFLQHEQVRAMLGLDRQLADALADSSSWCYRNRDLTRNKSSWAGDWSIYGALIGDRLSSWTAQTRLAGHGDLERQFQYAFLVDVCVSERTLKGHCLSYIIMDYQ